MNPTVPAGTAGTTGPTDVFLYQLLVYIYGTYVPLHHHFNSIQFFPKFVPLSHATLFPSQAELLGQDGEHYVGAVSNPLYTSSDKACHHPLKASLVSFVSMCHLVVTALAWTPGGAHD